MAQDLRFDGQVAVVTGAGGGLGRAYALELAARGAAVVVNDLGTSFDGVGVSSAMADAVVAEINRAGGRAVPSYDSVATSSGGKAIIQAAMDNFGRIDVLVSNAGTLRNAPLDQLEDDVIDAMLDVHLKGGFNVCRPALRAMKRQGYGRVVLSSSAAGVFGNPQQAAYGAAKAGLVGLMHILAIEGKPHGILANALLPMAASRMGAAMDPAYLAHIGTLFQSFGDRVGNTGTVDFVMPLVVYLCSRSCQSSHAIYSACLGRYAKVLIAACEGWLGPRDTPPSVEDIAAHWDTICAPGGLVELGSLDDEFVAIANQLGAARGMS